MLLIIGYFGYANNQLDGQTIKTRNVYEMLKTSGLPYPFEFFDTQSFQKSKINVLVMLWKVVRCQRLIYLPAHNNLTYFFPLIYAICKIFRTPIAYVVVGGWLADFLSTHRFHARLLSNIKLILPQTKALTDRLRRDYGFQNVVCFNNFRIHNFTPEKALFNNGSLKLVFMARIRKMKGLDTIFQMLDAMLDKYGAGLDLSVDFYGPIFNEEQEYFHTEVADRGNVRYRGLLEPDKIYPTLAGYDALLLPTKYYTEGFPGSVLDAYISGLPVIVTQWSYATEFVENGSTGLICNWDDPTDFIMQVDRIYQDRELLTRMKLAAYQRSKMYSMGYAREILKPFLGLS